MIYQNHQKQFYNVVMAAAKLFLLLLSINLLACGVFGGRVDVEATVAAGIEATRQAEVKTQATIQAAVMATQAATQSTGDQLPETTTVPPTPIPPGPTPNPPASISDPQQVRTVILDENRGAIAQDLEFLESLYTPDALVIDRNGTPDEPGDDTTWRGWANIERRYLAFFSAGFSSLTLVDLSIQVAGNQAMGAHRGVILDGILYPDKGVYTLEKINGQWFISQLEFGLEQAYDDLKGDAADQSPRDDGLYILEIGQQHRYEEPWGWDRGDPCQAWQTGDFDDTKPDHRGFNVELLLTNNSDTKAPDDWPISFTTARGKSVKACPFSYEGAGPAPGATSSVTFFTVVEKDDFVKTITLNLNDQTVRLCLDGKGGWSRC